jgi:hypothetical protein
MNRVIQPKVKVTLVQGEVFNVTIGRTHITAAVQTPDTRMSPDVRGKYAVQIVVNQAQSGTVKQLEVTNFFCCINLTNKPSPVSFIHECFLVFRITDDEQSPEIQYF